MKEFEKTYEFPSRYTDVRAVLADLLSALREVHIGGEDTGIVEVVLAEALNNTVEHAYREVPDGRILLDCSMSQAGLRIAMRDQGVAMPGLELPEGKCPDSDMDIQDLPEGGFGWHLIHTLTEELSYDRVGSENRTSFVIPLTGNP